MLVVVDVGDIDLADPAGGIVPIHFRDDADFQPPVTRDAQIVEDIDAHGELAGQGVAKAVKVIEIIGLADNLAQRTDQRGDQEAADPAVETSVGDARVVAFAELVIELGLATG